MEYNFKKYTRYDRNAAEHGVNFTPIDDAGNKYGTFKVSYFDTASKFVRVAMEEFGRVNAEKLRNTDKEKQGVLLFVNCFLHGWEDVLNGEDKAIPFSKDAAFAFFTSNPDDDWLIEEVLAFSKDGKNFQGDPRTKKGEDAKN